MLRRFGATDPGKLRVIEVQGTAMLPTLSPGDYVVIDEEQNRLSSNGLWVIWDGLEEAVRQVEIVPGWDPARVRITRTTSNIPATSAVPPTLSLWDESCARWLRSEGRLIAKGRLRAAPTSRGAISV
jgi:Peptidase S24-like